ncbi:MAG: dTMP kinase [Candidatus Latescibacteria bacterium]|jgi:dTMP kinase|nr:dTMP kinase [Candidatus Latescibacterota bacterium]
MKGYLITFEGIDGSGKSTQARLFQEYLHSLGRSAILLREPGGTDIGEKIRSLLADKNHSDMSPFTELFLFLAARAQITSTVIEPALEQGDDVIMDRFLDSTTAYQGYARNLGIEETAYLNLLATGGLFPDITFVIDCDPLTALSRVGVEPDRLESEGIEFMKKVREGFIKLCVTEPDRLKLIDGSGEIDVVRADIEDRVKHLFIG